MTLSMFIDHFQYTIHRELYVLGEYQSAWWGFSLRSEWHIDCFNQTSTEGTNIGGDLSDNTVSVLDICFVSLTVFYDPTLYL